MKIRGIVLTALLMGTGINMAGAQEKIDSLTAIFAKVPDFRISEQVPDFKLEKIIHSAKSTARISDFKDQLLIIDVWSTHCAPCIAGLPKMDSLQKRFGNKVKILPLTYEKEAVAKDFWAKNKHTKGLNLPFVVEDKKIRDYFKAGLGHEIWIYKGKVIGITFPEYVDVFNISQVLAGNVPNWPIKNDHYVFDVSKEPLFKLNPNQIDTGSSYFKYAALAPYKEVKGVNAAGTFGENSGIVRDAKKKTIRVYIINQSIFQAYLRNWLKAIDLKDLQLTDGSVYKSMVWKVANKSNYLFEPKSGTYEGQWMRDHAICYESVKMDEGQTDQQIYQAVIADLNRLLGLNVYWEKQKEGEKMVDKLVFAEQVEDGMFIDAKWTKLAEEAKARHAAQKGMKAPAAEEGKAFLESNKKKTGVVVLPSGLQYRIIKKGTGAKPGLNDKVKVHYTGILTNGKIFESSVERVRPVVLELKDMIKGWQEALPLMPVGSKWEISIPPALGYEDRDDPYLGFPSGSTLIFEIELIDIIKQA